MATRLQRSVTEPSAAGLGPAGATGGTSGADEAGGLAVDVLDKPGPRARAAVEVRGLRREFGGRAVIDGLDLTVAPGEFVALLGRSGCGKSTLLRVLAGLDLDVAGTVAVPRRRSVAFQEPRLLPWKRVWRNVALGLRSPRGSSAGESSAGHGDSSRARALAALAEVGLDHRVDAWPLTLSGGEAQRASLARALVREPDLLLLDEPCASLDALTRLRTQALIADLWARHAPAVVLVTHDVDEALALADRALVMSDGVISEDVAIRAARPRRPGDPEIVALRAHLLTLLGVPTPAAA
ncbi:MULTISPECIES: ABC transporter ATP-binding protein [Pseudofrankia]|uniref:ABC transporter ATP-binding protein n=1 Tax=Pseudofrankia TaxID=2994363 RepID=UPI000234B7D0|nr:MULTISPECIES: ABC transporter ATP-binding protein [Pseudofrankia]OHV35036.1 sulfonate ABC transporter ATP-binding protein [Pseudofrankia sp. EUN1h]